MSNKYKFFILPSVLLVLSLGYFFYLNVSSNFHTVTAGEAYRSAQLNSIELDEYIKKYNIRSILNLRGTHFDKQWYEEEIKASTKHNVRHYDIALSAGREPTEEEVQKLIEIFKNAPRPILIHCMSGADRTGLVSAMWKVVVDKEPKSEAEKQLSIRFGHIPILKTGTMDSFFRKWNPVKEFSSGLNK